MRTLQHDPILPEGPFSRACTKLPLVTLKWDLWVCPWLLHSALVGGAPGRESEVPCESQRGRQGEAGEGGTVSKSFAFCALQDHPSQTQVNPAATDDPTF